VTNLEARNRLTQGSPSAVSGMAYEAIGSGLLGADGLPIENKITTGVDYYKATMAYFAHTYSRDAWVNFMFINRDSSRDLLEYINLEELQQRFSDRRARGFDSQEIENFESQQKSDGSPVFSAEFLDWLYSMKLPIVNARKDHESKLAVDTEGPWPKVTWWETVVLSDISELYFEGMIRKLGLSLKDLWAEGDRRLTEMINTLNEHPAIKLIEMATRRRISYPWHIHAVGRLALEAPGNLIGSSNIYIANKLGIPVKGTQAHEMTMVYAALYGQTDASLRASTKKFLNEWYDLLGPDFATCLTDTNGTPGFLEDFTAEDARKWTLRQDSGDPYQIGEAYLNMYRDYGIDPMTKSVLFSDNLNTDKMVQLYDYFSHQTQPAFGCGTFIGNNLGPKPPNFVMKASSANGVPTVKLGDGVGKEMGPAEEVARHRRVFSPGYLVPILERL
jgi:nicotinate phosphoribosyltransferase